MSVLEAILILAQAGELGIPQEPVARPGAPFFRHDAAVTCAAMPRNGALLVVLDAAGRLIAWDTSTGRRRYVHPVLAPAAPAQQITCSPDARFAALSPRALPEGQVLVFDLADGKELRRLDRCFGPVFSSDGEILAGVDGSSLRRWALKSGAELPRLEETRKELKWTAFSPDGKSIAATFRGRYGFVRWDLETRKIIEQSGPSEHRPEATAVTFSPDDNRPVLGSFWGEGGLGGPPFFFVNEGRWMVSGSRRKLLQVWEVGRGNEPIFDAHVPFTSPEFIEVSDGGDVLLRVSGAGIQLETLPTPVGRMPAAGLRKSSSRVTGVGFTADGKIVVAEDSGAVLTWDPLQRKEVRRIALPVAGFRQGSTDGLRGIVIPPRESPRIWDLKDDRELLKLGGLERVSAGALTADGEGAAVGTLGGDVSIWDVGAGKEQFRLRNDVGVTALAWSLDRKTLAWGDGRGGVTFVDGRSGREPLRFEPRGSAITALTFLRDGKTAASGDRRGQVLLWKDEAGKEPECFLNQEEAIGALAASPDGRWLAVASGRRLQLHPIRRDEAPLHFQGHDREITALAFSPDGTGLISGGGDPTAILWRVPVRK